MKVLFGMDKPSSVPVAFVLCSLSLSLSLSQEWQETELQEFGHSLTELALVGGIHSWRLNLRLWSNEQEGGGEGVLPATSSS